MSSSDAMLGAVLPPALELMTAFSLATDEPELYWETMQRVVGEAMSGADPARAVAQLLFGQSALASILLDRLAEHTGRNPAELLADVHRSYLAA